MGTTRRTVGAVLAFGALGASVAAAELPLLGSSHAKHAWASYCEGKADDAPLPADPRTLVRPGALEGAAVFFNGYWEDCHVNAPAAERQATTCGEFRARRDRGYDFLVDLLPSSPVSAQSYADTWTKWGLDERPDNFDELYTLRYGLNEAPFDNPYPLPGQDPNATNGGSGRLPLGLRQMKDASGHWNGQIGSAPCFQCHGGQIGQRKYGDPGLPVTSLGLGNNNYDSIISGRDSSFYAQRKELAVLPTYDLNTVFNLGIKQRGQNNAVGAFELLMTILDVDSLGFNPNPAKTMVANGAQGVVDQSHPLAHTQDTPAWWNYGHRPRKFFDAGVSSDSTRIIMAAGPGDDIFSLDGKGYRDKVEKYDQDIEAFLLSLTSPEYPRAIDAALAERGAVLFHTKDLWKEAGNAEKPKPLGGNGSCAGCHGAYSPRYVNDPAFLPDPRLEGVAAHIVPLEVIGTDPARSDMLTPTLRLGWDYTYWAYPDGEPGFVPPEEKAYPVEVADDMTPLRTKGVCGWEKTVIGYQAPPLYGTWATAPYFHNGSVPTIEQVLDSSKRPAIWRRQLQTIGPVTGFDQRLSAYDFERLGWKHEALACQDIPGTELLNCNPVDDQGPSLFQLAQSFLNRTIALAGVVAVNDPAENGVDKRLVYDTRILGNDNGGHDFTDVLTEAERQAILEYLKTL
ncbi:MAG: hypothetical protein QOD06_2484 [Candidatus Binatota bacterium]|nr:hypothetical protein [Candidatus Binatota bacterium]